MNNPLVFSNVPEEVFKLHNADAIALYFFYRHYSNQKNTDTIYCCNNYCQQGLNIGLDRIQKAKKLLIANGLISTKILHDEKGRISNTFIVINRLTDSDVGGEKHRLTDLPLSGEIPRRLNNDDSGVIHRLTDLPLGGESAANINTINTKEEEEKKKEKKEEAGGESPSQGIGLNADANTFLTSSSKKPLIPKEEEPNGSSRDNAIINSINVSDNSKAIKIEDRVNHCPMEDNSIATFRIEFKKYLSINLLVYGKPMKNEIYDKIISIEEKYLLAKYGKIVVTSFFNHLDKNWKYYQTYYLYLFVTGAEKKDGDFQITKSLLIEKTDVAYAYFSLNRDKSINDLFDTDNFNNWKKSFELDVELKLSAKMKKAFPKLTIKEKQKLLDLKKAFDSEMIKLDDYLEFYVEKGGGLIANFFLAEGFLQRFYNYVNDDEQMRGTIKSRKYEIQKLNLNFIANIRRVPMFRTTPFVNGL